jgi:hypothetical protein
MRISNLGIQEMNHLAMIKLSGGQYFKPAIDGSFLANERVAMLEYVQSQLAKEGPVLEQPSLLSRVWSIFFLAQS